MSCSGVKTTGYWKGYPCHAEAPYTYRKRPYCAAHKVIAQENPGLFDKCVAQRAILEARKERKATREAEIKAKQIDWTEAEETLIRDHIKDNLKVAFTDHFKRMPQPVESIHEETT